MVSLVGPLVSAGWLAAHLTQPNLVVLDASLKKDNIGGLQIVGTRSFDIDEQIRDKTNPLPHMMPSPDDFAKEARAVGINEDSVVVIYDRAGIYSSPRARWMFQAMGHQNVAVLDGGFPAWLEAKLPVEPRTFHPVAPGNFVSRPCPQLIRSAAQVQLALTDPRAVVVDARSEGRFRGVDPEPRAGLRRGHMPNAINIPFTRVLKNGHMRSPAELAPLFSEHADKNMIFSCGSGVTACIVSFGAELAGYSDLAIYDGSWSEWGIPSALPVVTD